MEGTAKGQMWFEPTGCVTARCSIHLLSAIFIRRISIMDKETYNKLMEILLKKNKKKFVIVDSQKDKRFSNEHVYKNNEKIYNKE